MKLPRILVYILLVVAPNVALGEPASLQELGYESGKHWQGACNSFYNYKLDSLYNGDQIKNLKPIMYAACTYIAGYDEEDERLPFWGTDFICTIDGDRCKLANEVECWTGSGADTAEKQYSWNEENDNLTVYCRGGNDFSPKEYNGCVLIGPGRGSRKVEAGASEDQKKLCDGTNDGSDLINGGVEGIDTADGDAADEPDGAVVSGASAGTDLGTPGGDTTGSESPDASDSSEDSSDNDVDSASDEIIGADSESELSEQKIADLAKNASAMTKTEQSTANKLLGGASIAATGIGGMQLASAIAENHIWQHSAVIMARVAILWAVKQMFNCPAEII